MTLDGGNMKNLHTLALLFLLFVSIPPIAAVAQEQSQVFTLPEARVGEPYRADIEAVLRDSYRLRLDAGAKNAIIQWALANGVFSPGLALRANGTLVGEPPRSSEGTYSFRLKAADMSASNDDLILNFALTVKPGRLRLSKIEGPRLVPVDGTVLPASYAAS